MQSSNPKSARHVSGHSSLGVACSPLASRQYYVARKNSNSYLRTNVQQHILHQFIVCCHQSLARSCGVEVRTVQEHAHSRFRVVKQLWCRRTSWESAVLRQPCHSAVLPCRRGPSATVDLLLHSPDHRVGDADSSRFGTWATLAKKRLFSDLKSGLSDGRRFRPGF